MPLRRVLLPLCAVACVLPAHVDAAVPTGFVDELFATGLETPVGLAFLPDGRLLVTEQFSGQVEVVPVGAASSTQIFDITDVVSGGERGLLGVAVDPGWPTRPYLYFNFSHAGSVIYVRMYTVTGDLADPSSTNLVLGDPYDVLVDIPDGAFNHNGGTLRFGTDGMLLVSTGDDASFCDAQDLTSLSGKILRLDVSALPGAGSGPPAKSTITPADPAFPGPNANQQLVFCHGLRNPFRFSVDPVTGNLYIGDVGPSTWEEYDEATGGENFGWPKREGAHTYGPGAGCAGSNGTDPIAEYDRSGSSASIIGGPRYRVAGALSFPASYDGDAFFHDYYQGWMRRITFNTDTGEWETAAPVAGQPSADSWATGLAGVPEMIEGPDGALYYVTQFGAGQVRRIANANVVAVSEATPPSLIAPILTVRPNPSAAGDAIRISYTLPSSGYVHIAVYSVVGSRVATVFDGAQVEGEHVAGWRPREAAGVAAGVYFLRMETPGAVVTRKLTLTR